MEFFASHAAFSLDRTFAVLAGAALLGGLVRGFTGFGFAMVFMPLAGLVAPLSLASAMIWVMDAPFALVLGARHGRKASWREVLPLLAGATALFPAGVWLLVNLPPLSMRWIIALLIFGAVAALATGWRWHGRAGTPLSLGVGSLSGLIGGLSQMGGLPLAIFWLSAQKKAPAQMRHDLIAYFACATIVSGVTLWAKGILNPASVTAALPLVVPYGLGVLIGSRLYGLASDATFRRIAYVVIALSALVSLPLWDGPLGRG